MAISRRTMVGSLGVGLLSAGVLSGCGEGGVRRGRRRATTTAPTAKALGEPDTPLVIGSIGASFGRSAPFESAIAIGVREGFIDVNARFDGLFGHEVGEVTRHVMAEPGEDLTDVIATFKDSGVTAVITSLDEDSLAAALPALVEAQMAVIDIFTSGMSVRADDLPTAGLLVRLSPNDQVMAARYVEAAFNSSSERAGAPGTVAFISEDTAQGQSLLHHMTELLNPRGGSILHEHRYTPGDMGDIAPVIAALKENPPALLVLNGGPEAGAFLSELHTASLDEGNRPTIEIPARLGPAATVDYTEAGLAPECMTRAEGYEPGGELTVEHVNMMINIDANLMKTGFAYSQQAYDAVVLACLAAQDALAVGGTEIAASIPRVLTGTEDCTDFGGCRVILRDALAAGSRATVTYEGRTGALEIGGKHADARKGSLRMYTWGPAGQLEAPGADTFEAAG